MTVVRVLWLNKSKAWRQFLKDDALLYFKLAALNPPSPLKDGPGLKFFNMFKHLKVFNGKCLI